MAYIPLTPMVLVPGLSATGADSIDVYGRLLDNVDRAYIDYNPPVFGPCATRIQTSSTSYVMVAEWKIPGNVDKSPMYCRIRWRGTTSFTATVKFEIDDGTTADNVTDTTTSSSYAATTLSLTPTSANSPRLGRLYLKVSNALAVAQIVNVVCGYAVTTYPTGILDSGAAQFDGAWPVANYPVPREVIERGHNNLRAIARDRICGLAGGLNRYDVLGTSPPGPVYEVSGSTWTAVERWIQPGSDRDRRPYFLAMKLAGTNPEARMLIGPHLFDCDGTGWTTDIPQISLSEGMPGAIYLRSASGSDAQLSTWQVMRQPLDGIPDPNAKSP